MQNPNTGYKLTQKSYRQLAFYWFATAAVLIIITGQIPTSELCQPSLQYWFSTGCKQNPNTGYKLV